MTIKSFKRYEIKYFVTIQQYQLLKAELEKRMVLDENCAETGSYMIYNLYFDTDDDAVIRHSLEKPYYKEKLRLRSYTIPKSGDDLIFLELKKKIGGIVAKRRATIPYSEALNFVYTGKVPETDNYQDRQVLNEIKDFLDRCKVKPTVFISYERNAYFDKNDSEFRVSFDKQILTRRTQVNLIDGNFGTELIGNDCYLMEIKCAEQIPMWLCRIMSKMKIYSTGFSKYGTEYKNYFRKKEQLLSHDKCLINNPEALLIQGLTSINTAI